MSELVKEGDLSSPGHLSAWVQVPLRALESVSSDPFACVGQKKEAKSGAPTNPGSAPAGVPRPVLTSRAGRLI
jgi:hypothetical protein